MTALLSLLAEHGIAVDPADFECEASIPNSSPVSNPQPDYVLGYVRHGVTFKRRRSIHRYCRIARFLFTLGQLLGTSGAIPAHVVHVVRLAFQLAPKMVPPAKAWNFVRARLKQYGWRLYYNRIPALLAHPSILEHLPWHPDPCSQNITRPHSAIVADFHRLHANFQRARKTLGRIYFPNLRYVALRLMERHQLLPPYPIPFARTLRKKKSLCALFETLDQME